MREALNVALVSDVFFDEHAGERLRDRLADARTRGADLALLPEIPLNPWSPATTTVRDEDAEPPDGPRHRMLAGAARDAGIGVVGGAIVRDPGSGCRHNTALVFDAAGCLAARYAKVHLPDEPGFHEPCHYEPGAEMARVIRDFGFPLGLQICSDINRPVGSHLLAAQGAMAILNPRATEAATFGRWRLVFRANALTSCAYVLSVNRPSPEQGVPLGGPSIAVDPNGEVLVETTDAVAVVRLEAAAVEAARRRYPGYLEINADLCARAWSEVREERKTGERREETGGKEG
jgi:predicted amidohydrolase